MEVSIPLGVISTAITAVSGAVVWALRLVTQKHVAFIETTEKTQREILAVVQRMDEEMRLSKKLDRLHAAIAKVAPYSLFCDDCGGWFGPSDSQQNGRHPCVCHETPKHSA